MVDRLISDRSQQSMPQMLTRNEVAAMLGVSPATFHRYVEAGKAPKPIKFSRGCVRWRLLEVQNWIRDGCPSIRE